MRRLGAVLVVAFVLLPAAGYADTTTLVGTVGPGFSISIDDASGQLVRTLDPGGYTIQAHDLSAVHNLHLVGPGVDQATEVDGTGDFTWPVTLANGAYQYFCDVHATLRGSFTVGTQPPTVQALKLIARVGPGAKISLKTPAGKRAKRTAAGVYSIVVRDASTLDNFHLTGPGVNRKSRVGKKQTLRWKLTLRPGTYRYRSDAHPKLRGSLVVNAVT